MSLSAVIIEDYLDKATGNVQNAIEDLIRASNVSNGSTASHLLSIVAELRRVSNDIGSVNG
jgi:hypothetical protein